MSVVSSSKKIILIFLDSARRRRANNLHPFRPSNGSHSGTNRHPICLTLTRQLKQRIPSTSPAEAANPTFCPLSS